MKTFAVYEKSENDRVAVKVGFCWPGLVWSGFWLLCVRLWEQAGTTFGVFAVLYFGTLAKTGFSGLSNDGRDFLSVSAAVMHLIIGWRGNKWRRTNLRARGFKHLITLEASSKDEALAKLHEKSVEELKQEAEEKKTAEAIEKALKTRPRV